MGVTAKPLVNGETRDTAVPIQPGDSQNTEQREASQHQGRGQPGPQKGDGYTNLRLYIKKSIFFNVY